MFYKPIISGFENHELKVQQLISYFELFDYTLKKHELARLSNLENIDTIISTLNEKKFVEIKDDFIYPAGKENLIRKRLKGEENYYKNLKKIKIVSRIIASFPFVRCLLLTGSASKGCMSQNDDFDFLVITKKNRLWICRSLIHILRKIVSFNGRNFNFRYFCCNYYIDESDLKINDINEFVAIETFYAKPVFGLKIYNKLLEQNSWIKNYFHEFKGNDLIKPFFFNFSFLKYIFELFINSFIFITNIIFRKNYFENRLINVYTSHWKKLGIINNRKKSLDSKNNKYVKPPNGSLRQDFLLKRFDNCDMEYSSALRTKVMLMKLSSSRYNSVQPDILLTHAFYLNASRTEKKIMKPNVPLGPLYVGAYLRDKGYRIDFFDTTFQKTTYDFRKYLIKTSPPIVGIYIIEPTKKNALEMIKIAKKFGSIVIAGGPDPSIKPQFYIDNGVDLVVVGEGEETAFDLMEAIYKGNKDIRSIPGIFSTEGFTPRESIKELDIVSLPARDLVDFSKYFSAWNTKGNYKTMFLMTSRGCPFKCSWCSKPVFGSCYRTRSPKNVVDEIKYLNNKYNPERYWINDDIFGLNRKWIKEFHDEIIKENIRIKFECLSRVDLVDDESLLLLKESGCFKIWFGAESGSDKILNSMIKGFNTNQIRKATNMAKAHGIEVNYFIILGYPGETTEDIDLTRQLLKEAVPKHAGITIAFPLEGTQFYDEVKSELINKNKFFTDINARLIFKTKYSLLFYRLVRRLLTKELQLLNYPDKNNIFDNIKLNLYKSAYKTYKFFYSLIK